MQDERTPHIKRGLQVFALPARFAYNFCCSTTTTAAVPTTGNPDVTAGSSVRMLTTYQVPQYSSQYE